MLFARPSTLVAIFLISVALASAAPLPIAAQSASSDALRIVGVGGGSDAIRVPLHRDRGFTAISARALTDLGWTLSRGVETLGVSLGDGPAFLARVGTPFLLWQGQKVQLTHAPYLSGRDFFLPLQVLSDVLPFILDDLYSYESATRTLRVEMTTALRRPDSAPVRVVVIDPGHGGEDPGTRGAGGTLEKDVALAIGQAVARELRGDPGLEVHMIRDSDVYIHPWERGEIALGWKGDRPGVFLSIHANAVPSSTAVRGFETYFLSEARTEHERRVAAVENAPIYTGRVDDAPPDDGGLTAILRELRYVDDQHWSSLLAELVQDELGGFHPGPNRGVKQAPLAVLTNSLMPSVLIEVGFLSNRTEEQLLAQREFQQQSAASIARAVRSFFQRYPPGSAASADR